MELTDGSWNKEIKRYTGIKNIEETCIKTLMEEVEYFRERFTGLWMEIRIENLYICLMNIWDLTVWVLLRQT